jgi:hypothetical protein
MIRPKTFSVVTAAVFACLTLFSLTMASAQQAAPTAKRTVLERHDLSVPGREGVLVLTELQPGAKEPKHTHPGDLFAYIQEGTITLYQDGQPTTHLDAGAQSSSFQQGWSMLPPMREQPRSNCWSLFS